MDATSIFFLIQAVSISIYLTLAVYVFLSRSPNRISLPFILFASIQAFIAYSFFLLRSPAGTPESIPTILRFRWAISSFLPALFLHMFLPLVREGLQRIATVCTQIAYGLGIVTAIGFLFTDFLITDIINRGPQGADLLDPVFNSLGITLASIWVILSMGAASFFLTHATRDQIQPRIQADAKRLLPPWILLILAGLLGSLSIAVSSDSTQGISLYLSLSDRILSIAAGILLARGILGYGSPAGSPIHHRLVPAILPFAAVIVADYLLVYCSEFLNSPLLLVRLLLFSLLGGAILASPELPQHVARWLGSTPPDDTNFAIRLNRAWESLVEGSFNVAQVAEMLLALQEQIQAGFVGVLELVDIDENRKLSFGRWEDGPRFFLHAEPFDWPLSEENLPQTDYEFSKLPGPPTLILPIHDDQNLAGILIIGEPIRGGVFSTSDLRLAELLAGQISFALGHGLRLEETLGVPKRVEPDAVILPKVNVAIRTFGRLDIYTQYGETKSPRLSLRARQILAILLSSYPDPVPAESLMDRLWPEHSRESAANSLYVAIYALRRSLEPDLQKGAVSRYVQRESDCYKLIINEDLWVDFIEFIKLYWAGKDSLVRSNERRARRSFERAIRMCRRPFLADATLDLPAEVEVTRHQLQRFMHEMVWYLTDIYVKKENWAEAERVLFHSITMDHHDHEAREMLADIYQRQGKNGLAEELKKLEG
jgi:DNA-binding SARP family transcriptional activator